MKLAGLSREIEENLHKGSWIRKLFDEGARLKKEFGDDQVFDFSLGNPIVEPPEAFKRALREEVEKGNHGYIQNQGLPAAREKVAQFLGSRFEAEFAAERVVMTVGAGGALNVALKSIVNPGEEVIILAPYFAEYKLYIENYGGKAVSCPLTPRFEIDIEAVRQSITPKTKGLILNTPHNPTGTVLSQKNIDDLGALLKEIEGKNGQTIYVLFDEPYSQLIYDAELANPFQSYHRVILASSFSKDLGIAGERLGYIGLDSKMPDSGLLINAFVYCNRTLGFVNAPVMMQRAVARMDDVRVDASAYKARRDLMVGILKEAGFEFEMPKGGFFVFPKSPIEDEVAFCVHAAQKYKLLIVPSSGFGIKGHFRLSFSVPIEQIKNSRDIFVSLYKDFA
ncbi:pyridoxal phosphate-dependent aminotransferase [Bacillus vallismortis]|uniref:pyridoxal phosphate-dependent aminotransferase n=1 Tax=Bacillus vallismortis TaxID=72361 RepID=UPI000EF523E3|nr:pyridoxal phosphate-dependent aminotransferase [Bacillus vallismortis]MCI4136046.1 pyridoxal phosphate-dependent aminotransferase [Bacillus vallismortis]MCY7893201.1 pyridoxal phosphate-dependent aminotransferase [Bacillus vallismortis]MCY8425136.1 pyridoxal phosphate-dependent aminotransferase [Bacillus vallismortis]